VARWVDADTADQTVGVLGACALGKSTIGRRRQGGASSDAHEEGETEGCCEGEGGDGESHTVSRMGMEVVVVMMRYR
jgi:hypothetical protein